MLNGVLAGMLGLEESSLYTDAWIGSERLMDPASVKLPVLAHRGGEELHDTVLGLVSAFEQSDQDDLVTIPTGFKLRGVSKLNT